MLMHPDVPRVRVMVVDDLAQIREVIRVLVDLEPDLECVGCSETADNLVNEARNLNADIVLLDASMPGCDPLGAMSELSRALPHVRTIVVSGRDDGAFIDQAMECGAWGCVSKYDPPTAIVRAVRQVAAGKAVLDRHAQPVALKRSA
jgi:DNA-binding NarL/FixJ family response regulator